MKTEHEREKHTKLNGIVKMNAKYKVNKVKMS